MKKRILAAFLALTLLLGIWTPALAEQADGEERPYYIEVDVTNQIVTVYRVSDDSVARQMICSTGVHNSTPLGTYYMPKKWKNSERKSWYWFDVYMCYAKWATRIYADILFHSIIFDDNDDNKPDKKSLAALGSKASHGCVRLKVEDARFIAENCLSGTQVKIFESDEPNEVLRMRLKHSSYTGEDGESYEDFLAISDTGMGMGDEGENVSDLQARLQALGYYNGSVSGFYDMDTVSAVKQLQNDLGVHATGTVESELEQIIYSEDVPLSTEMVDMVEGQNGPVVRKFQTALQKLGFYNEEIDGVFDLGVIESVKAFQKACGIEANGVASTELQHLVYFELNKVEETLGTEEFTPQVIEEETLMASSSNEKQKLNVRAKASAKSDQLGQLGVGEEVMMFGTQEDWAKILYNGQIAYVLRKSLQTYVGTNSYIQYSANGKTVTIGCTAKEIEEGTAVSAMQELRDYYAEHKDYAYLDKKEEYVTVNTGADNVTLNLRSDASGDSEVIAQLPNGTSLRMLARGGDWTSVRYEDQIGYLMSQYLEFGGSAGDSKYALEAVDAYEEEEIVTVTPRDASDSVNVYAEADEGSAVIRSLPVGTQLSVLSIREDTGWVQVSDGTNEGYIQGTNLTFGAVDA